MTNPPSDPQRFARAISYSGLSIYDLIEIGDKDLWIPAPELQALLDKGLKGISLAGLPLRTRSKIVKEHVCRTLGYPVPASFKRTQPRFRGQLFDTYIQKSNNLQIWNEELAPARRYALIRVSKEDVVTRVKVVTGDALALLDMTGTLTQKYQARCIPGKRKAELIAESDTDLLRPLVSRRIKLEAEAMPIDYPQAGQLLSIKTLFNRLKAIVGVTFDDKGHDQERHRGAALHRLVCNALRYGNYRDDGQFPDIRHQLLEVKLQTSPTIDLGLASPDSAAPLDVPQIDGRIIRHRDVRYAIFYGRTDGTNVTLTHILLTTGERFFGRFPRFEGKILNKKLQVPLPADFFDI